LDAAPAGTPFIAFRPAAQYRDPVITPAFISLPLEAPSMSRRRVSRRTFLSASAAASGALALGAYVNPAPAQESKSPSERVRVAGVGTTNQAAHDLGNVAAAGAEIVALANVDDNLMEKGAAAYKGVRKYRDYRIMLEKEDQNIDAVVVATPDHSHAPAAAMALRLGKHTFCEKPLTHTVKEARTLAELAKAKKLVTQMGTQIHAGDNYRRVVELIKAGAIGSVAEVHVWAGAVYTNARFTADIPAPTGLDWDLWLGPARKRPYSDGVHPFKWRAFWDYGTGTLGDFGCHYMDLAHWALDLRAPTAVEATGTPYDPVSTPGWCLATYEYPARGKMPAVKLKWYDSGKRPELLASFKGKDGKGFDWNGGQIFVGSEGTILSNYGEHNLFPADKFADYKRPEPTIPASIGHYKEWVEAIKSGGTTTCNFDYSGALTEAVLLGTVAYRSGKRIEWDAASFKITNAPDAEKWLHKEYRQGWTL
jgi:predicted dehydrogenase